MKRLVFMLAVFPALLLARCGDEEPTDTLESERFVVLRPHGTWQAESGPGRLEFSGGETDGECRYVVEDQEPERCVWKFEGDELQVEIRRDSHLDRLEFYAETADRLQASDGRLFVRVR